MSVENKLVGLLKERHLSVSAAESCTGGLISERITSVPGASGVFPGGVVSYAVSVKEKVLCVPASVIDTFGVVSPETARAMAEGVLKLTGSDVAVSVTGYAGPTGGDGFAPVGTVCIGIAAKDYSDARRYNFFENGVIDREAVRSLAADEAMNTAVRYILESDLRNA